MSCHLFKASMWESGGQWHSNDTTRLVGVGGKWWVHCRVLGQTPAQFVSTLKAYGADISFNKILIFSWKKYSDCEKYTKYINKIAKEKGVFVNDN